MDANRGQKKIHLCICFKGESYKSVYSSSQTKKKILTNDLMYMFKNKI